MKKIILGFTLTMSIFSFAQENKDELIGTTKNVETSSPADTVDGWKKGGVFNLNFSNVGLQNWAAGGANSYSFTVLTGLYANLTKGKATWDNNLDLGLGSIQQFAPGSDAASRQWVKSDDKIDFTSKFGQKASKDWYYSGLVNFKSQFLEGYSDPYANKDSLNVISKMFAPAYALAAIGMDYKPNKEFSAFLAPVTSKITIVADDNLNSIGAFGVDSGSVVRSEFGFYMRLMYTKDVVKNVNFSSKLEFFTNYQEFSDPNGVSMDVNWETLTSMKVNEYISATFSTHLIYDDDIDIAQDFDANGVAQRSGPAIQFKHVLGVGLTYKF